MTVKVTRSIIEGGATRTETLTSKYQPWRAIYLVGSESDIPASVRNAATEETPTAAGAATVDATVTETTTAEPSIEATTPVTGSDQ